MIRTLIAAIAAGMLLAATPAVADSPPSFGQVQGYALGCPTEEAFAWVNRHGQVNIRFMYAQLDERIAWRTARKVEWYGNYQFRLRYPETQTGAVVRKTVDEDRCQAWRFRLELGHILHTPQALFVEQTWADGTRFVERVKVHDGYVR